METKYIIFTNSIHQTKGVVHKENIRMEYKNLKIDTVLSDSEWAKKCNLLIC